VVSELTFDNTKKIIDTPDYKIQINEAGEGTPIFMIHGTGPGGSGWSNFAPNVKVLSAKYRCIAVTMPGWGESSPQSLQTGRDQPGAIRQLMDAMGIERGVFVGNSMGGGIATSVTALYPERVSHLITMGVGLPGVNYMTPGGLGEGIRVIVETYSDPSAENFDRLVKVMCYDPSFATDELSHERSNAASAYPEHNKNWLDFFRAGPGENSVDVLGKLRNSQVPALIIHGRDDRTVHYESSLRLVSTIPNSRMVLLNRCGHWAQLEHADEFNRMVAEFIENN
jgi:2-hydroxy-6-oxonona-2,4-dienedioate hydrolase